MKVYVPYTEIQPATSECLEPYEYTAVKMIEETDYLSYFQQRWEEGESFLNIEHDTVFERGAIEELESCPEEWCAYCTGGNDAVWDQEKGKVKVLPFRIKHFVDGVPPTLALMKIERSFIKKHPDVWDGFLESDRKPKWVWLDSWLDGYTRSRGILCHQHYRKVVNANPLYPPLEELEKTGEIHVLQTVEGASAGVHMPTIMVENNILDKNGKRIKKQEQEKDDK